MLSKKLSAITPSMTIGISTKVAELRAQGESIINLSIGEPDFMTPDSAKERALWAIEQNKTKYDSASGLLPLREAICKKLKVENNLDFTPENIVVSSGAKHSITNCLLALLNPGDEVIVPKPYWTSYPEMIKLAGGVPIFVETTAEDNYKLTTKLLENSITERTKLLFINNPSNPAGTVYTAQELAPLVDCCIKNNVLIIADEIYERICYTKDFTSVAGLSEQAKDITIVVNGLSKSAAMTGWRLGYTACKKEISKAISTIQGHLVSHPSTISQWAALGALEGGQQQMNKMVASYKLRRDEAVRLFEKNDRIKIIQPDGAFYLFIDLSVLKDKFVYGSSFSVDLCARLLEKEKIALVPGIAFGMDDFVRMSYAADIEDVKEGISRLLEFVNRFF